MSAATESAREMFGRAADAAARIERDLDALRAIFDRVGCEDEAGFVSEMRAEFLDFAVHVAALKEK